MIDIFPNDLAKALKQSATLIESHLEEILSQKNWSHSLQEAIRYCVLGSGKRLRPFLCFAVLTGFKQNPKKALDLAAAIELIHSYSLIHDDLPAMDDDDFRRGKLTCHKKFDEATAILTGDALLTFAFEILAKKRNSENCDLNSSQILEIIDLIAKSAGMNGMVGGQMLDLKYNQKSQKNKDNNNQNLVNFWEKFDEGEILRILQEKILTQKIANSEEISLKNLPLTSSGNENTTQTPPDLARIRSHYFKAAYGKNFEEILEILFIHHLKTGKIFALCCEASSIIAAADYKTRQKLCNFGHYFGLAYQIFDDFEDIKTPKKADLELNLVAKIGENSAFAIFLELKNLAKSQLSKTNLDSNLFMQLIDWLQPK